MKRVLKISDAASLAFHACLDLAQAQGQDQSVRSIAERLEVSEHHLSKVLNRLARFGIVRSKRGAGGGFSLGRNPASVSLLEIYEAVEGPLEQETCLLGKEVCIFKKCLFGTLFSDISKQVKAYLSKTTLRDVVDLQLSEGRVKRRKSRLRS